MALNNISLSPNSLNLYLECPRCFWLEKKQGIKRPEPYPYDLNTAVDLLLKKEFDEYRKKGGRHPLLAACGIKAKLFSNQKLLNQWRDNLKGLRYYDKDLEATIFGAVDDILEFPDGKLAPLDYKSIGGDKAGIYDRFQLQMDIYSYLLEKNGFATVGKGYLAFYIVNKGNSLGNKSPLRKEIQEIQTDLSDLPELIKEAVAILKRPIPPAHSRECQYGQWFKKASVFE